MDAIVLAGGYATRLHPVTVHISKPLLRVAGRPIVSHVLDRLEALGEIRRAFVVTNDKFYRDYQAWEKREKRPFRVIPLNDGTTSNEDRLGAVGDIHFALDKGQIEGDVIVVGGDNLFDFDLRPFRAFQRALDMPGLGCYDVERLELVSLYSEVRIENDRVVRFVEKPERPTSTLIGILCYLLRRDDVTLVHAYLNQGHNPDKAGHLIQWLVTQQDVCGYRFSGRWVDIGTKAELERAERLWAKAGKTESPEQGSNLRPSA